ncbi:hypothetical protein ACQ4M3_13230 [Leptolyngbya sp. AN03gr2]|uniref:hypothetical protein n=1 Tax=unclassified Leptolyngbya TaxID=2650499 RepID=UPI003D3129F7
MNQSQTTQSRAQLLQLHLEKTLLESSTRLEEWLQSCPIEVGLYGSSEFCPLAKFIKSNLPGGFEVSDLELIEVYDWTIRFKLIECPSPIHVLIPSWAAWFSRWIDRLEPSGNYVDPQTALRCLKAAIFCAPVTESDAGWALEDKENEEIAKLHRQIADRIDRAETKFFSINID